MRIWSLHPKYLDTKGLLAVWRETLLAKHVLEGKTKGYKNHPQLDRFKKAQKPLDAINQYLAEIFAEASHRKYNFSKEKIDWSFQSSQITVTKGQFDYEVQHLLKKLALRDPKKYQEIKNNKDYETHSLFKIVPGEIESWEVVADL